MLSKVRFVPFVSHFGLEFDFIDTEQIYNADTVSQTLCLGYFVSDTLSWILCLRCGTVFFSTELPIGTEPVPVPEKVSVLEFWY